LAAQCTLTDWLKPSLEAHEIVVLHVPRTFGEQFPERIFTTKDMGVNEADQAE
jgi:hypothetical protein